MTTQCEFQSRWCLRIWTISSIAERAEGSRGKRWSIARSVEHSPIFVVVEPENVPRFNEIAPHLVHRAPLMSRVHNWNFVVFVIQEGPKGTTLKRTLRVLTPAMTTWKI